MIPYCILPITEKQAMWQAWSNNETVSWAFQIKPTREVRMGLVALLGALYIQLSWHELNYHQNGKVNDLLAEFSRLKWIILIMAAGFSCILVFFIFRLSFKYTWLIASVVIPMVFFIGLLYWRLPSLGKRWWIKVKAQNEHAKTTPLINSNKDKEQGINSKKTRR
jgi:sensor histidine kinase YesM